MTWVTVLRLVLLHKMYYMFKTFANRSRRVRDVCEDFAILCERFATVRDGLANRFPNPSRTRRIPVRYGLNHNLCFEQKLRKI